MFSTCSREFPPISLTIKTRMLGLSPLSTLDQSGVGPWALHCSCPLFLGDGLNAETKFHCTLYM